MHTSLQNDGRYEGWARGVLRIVAALLFMEHGLQKLLAFPAPAMPGGGPVALASQMGVAGVLELFGGALVLVGLFTRPVAFLLAGEMAVAYFQAHAPRGFWPILNKGELPVLYCFTFLYFFVAGAGAFSLDAWRARRRVGGYQTGGVQSMPPSVAASRRGGGRSAREATGMGPDGGR